MALVSIHTAANKRNKKITSRIDINDNLLLTFCFCCVFAQNTMRRELKTNPRIDKNPNLF